MHVSHHFKHFALQPKTSVPARKKPVAGTEYASRVESRFGEDEAQENRDRQGQTLSHQDGTGGEAQERAAAIVPDVVTPSIQVAPVLVTSPLDIVLARLINVARGPAGLGIAISQEGAPESSLEDLLALMRAASPDV